MLSAGRLNVESVRPGGDQITPSNVNVPRGHIVNITSVAGAIPGVGLSDYCASKAASLRMSECLELELRQMGLQNSIHVTNVLPFLMDTRLFRGSQPLRQWLFPIVNSEYCARRVVQAVRSNERTVYVTARYRLLSIIKW
ncbi:unnamed protein product [Echinostoma caproni]|uniref:Dehydrogenase/reductase SDR family member 11 n=1 Tax=Echinostoma caproni TaxID=27848 RepID=A0A183AGK4_9TREM|nr:unnamed protein product [Echinostoma caproni]